MTSIEEFSIIVSGMLCPENEARLQSEKQYDQIPLTRRAELLFQLFIDQSVNVEARSLCMVLLRRLFTTQWEDIWSAWGEQNQHQFCAQLLRSVTSESEPALRKRLTDVIAEVARITIDKQSGRQKWQEILQFLEVCGTSDLAELREIAMSLLENVPAIFGCDQDSYLPWIKQMFQTTLVFESNSSVRTAAVRAYVAFVSDCEEGDQTLKLLSDQIPTIIKVCQHVVTTEDEDDVPLQCLSDLASTVPKIFMPYLPELFALCSSTVANKEKEDSYRYSAMEVMVSLCENAPKMMKKKGTNYVATILQHCLDLMCELGDDIEEWLANDDDDDDDDDEDSATIGESSLDRVACNLGGKTVFAPLLQMVPRLIQDEQNWKNRYAGIMSLSTAGEGCKRQMLPVIEDIVNNIITFLSDPHPRVRYAACNAVGQMSTDFAPKLQKKFHEKIVNGLCTLIADLAYPRVATHASAALVNFCEDCPKEVIGIYLPLIMEKLEYVLDHTFKRLMEHGNKFVLEQVITTIASVADCAQDHFINFYDRLIPPLKYIFQNSTADELLTLRGKAIECISLIGSAVGKERFSADANEVMQMLLANQSQIEQLSSNDPQINYMISSWTRICKVLGEAFAAYLPVVMPPVLRAASLQPDVAILDNIDVEEQKNDQDWEFIPVNDNKTFAIKTSGLEEKATACEMLVCYAHEIKGPFSPYIESISELMLPLLKFMFHDGVRAAAAAMFPCLLECARERGDEYRTQFWDIILSAYKGAIEAEHDRTVLAEQLRAIAQCVESLGSSFISQPQLEIVVTLLNEQTAEYLKRSRQREKYNKSDDGEDDDVDVIDEELEEEAEVLSRISDLVHCLFKIYGQSFLPFFDIVAPHLISLLTSRRNFTERQWMLCIFDDVIEYCGEASAKYQQAFYNPFIAALSDEYPEVRQAAAYGFGIMGQYGGLSYAQACAGALPHLANMISNPESRSTDENISATENAISAVAKILKYNSSMVDINAVIPTFLGWLPIWDDADEMSHVYGYLADLIESNNPLVLGENHANLPRVVSIIVVAFEKGAFGDVTSKSEIKSRLINIIKFMQTDAQLFQEIIKNAGFNDSQVTILHQLLA